MTARQPADAKLLAAAYLRAKRMVIEAGYEHEIVWQEDAGRQPLTETRFLSEAAWVVLSSGMRETVVRRVFPDVAEAFANFVSAADAALAAAGGGRARAIDAFGHARKIDAILEIVLHVAASGLSVVERRLQAEGASYLQSFSYLGPVTALHLAKNLGCEFAKPDRHLTRIADACGYRDAEHLCGAVQSVVGESVAVIDIVLWRFATLNKHYLSNFAEPSRPAGLAEAALGCPGRPSGSRN